MRTPKRIVPLLGCVGLSALFVVGMIGVVRPPLSPLNHAQAIVQTTRWLPENGNPGGFPVYYWSGGNDLTYFATGKDGTPHLFRRPMAPQVGLPDQEGPAVHLRGGYPGQLSPDGKWFVEWHQNRLHQNIPTFVAMDGTVRRTGEPTWGMEGVWTPGSDAMLCGVWRTNAAIDLYRPASGPVQKIALIGLPHFYAPQRVALNGHLIGFEDSNFILHFANARQLASVNYPLIKMARVDRIHPDAQPEQWKVAVPKNVDNGFCILSPSGDRILWVVYGDTTLPLIQQVKHFLPGMSTQSNMGYRWLISGLHGEDMHEIASYPYPTGRIKAPNPATYSRPHWMPDSKHLSFIYKEQLYLIPVE